MAKKTWSYNEALKRLQEIQQQIESDDLDIDQMTEIIKEASSLLKICKDKLFKVSEETNKILEDLDE